MEYQELCKMIIALSNELFDNVIDETESEETSITIGADLNATHHIKITIEKREKEDDIE